MPTINITKSGTLNPALSRIDNNDFTTTAYAAGDVLSISNNARLTINSSTAASLPGTIQANSATSGIIAVENTSTTTPMVVALSTQNSNFTLSGRSQFSVRGAWIVVATGTGAASQTIDFSASGPMGVAIDLPPCVWVETGDSSDTLLTVAGTPGYFKPFFNCYETTDALGMNILTHFHGDLDHGNVFQFNRTTRMATFGKGGTVGSSNGGAVIPTGARVLYPNIHFTSSVFDAVVANRNELNLLNSASGDLQICAFSLNFGVGYGSSAGTFASGDITMKHVALGGVTVFQSQIGALRLENVAVGPDYSTAASTTTSTHLLITTATGAVYLDFLYALHKVAVGASTVSLLTISTAAQIGTIKATQINTSTSTGRNVINFSGVANLNEAPLPCGPFYVVGGRFASDSISSNLHIKAIYASDRATAVVDTTVANNAVTLAGSYITLAKLRKLANGVAPRGVLITTGVQNLYVAIKDVVFDCQNNAQEAVRLSGQKSYAANFTVDNIRVSVLSDSRGGIKGNRISNIRSNSVSLANGALQQGALQEWSSGSTASWATTSGAQDCEPFNSCYTNAAFTAGMIRIGPFAVDNYSQHLSVISGVDGTDFYLNKNNAIYLESAGVELVFTGNWPMRGISNFTGASFNITGSNATTNATYEIAMKNPADNAWGSWFDASVASNWETARAALNGYDAALGFNLKLRIKTSGSLAGRLFNYAYITCTTNPAWAPAEIGYVPIKATGALVGSAIKLYDATNPNALLPIAQYSMNATTQDFDFPYHFDATAKPYQLKLRKAGYGELIASGSTYQLGKTIPFSQVLAVAVDEVAASSITGISINAASNTISMTSNHSIGELYAYCQYWSAQLANMDAAIPLITSDGVNFSSAYHLTINSAALSGSGVLRMLTTNLTISGGGSSSVNIIASNGRTGFLRIDGLAAHTLLLQNGGGAVLDYQAGISGSYSYFVPATATGNWQVVLKKPGETHQVIRFDAASGGAFNFTANTALKCTPDGAAMYQASSSALVNVDFNGSTQASISIGNGTASLQAVFDVAERALITQAGMEWLAAGKNDLAIFNSGGGDYLFMSDDWRLRRASPSDVNATIQAFVSSSQGAIVDGSNGSVQFITSDTPAAIAAAVRSALASDFGLILAVSA